MGQAGVVSITVNETFLPSIAISRTMPSVTMSLCKSGSSTLRRASKTFSCVIIVEFYLYEFTKKWEVWRCYFYRNDAHPSNFRSYPLRFRGNLHYLFCFQGMGER